MNLVSSIVAYSYDPYKPSIQLTRKKKKLFLDYVPQEAVQAALNKGKDVKPTSLRGGFLSFPLSKTRVNYISIILRLYNKQANARKLVYGKIAILAIKRLPEDDLESRT